MVKLVRYSLLFWLPYMLASAKGYQPNEAGNIATMFEVGGLAGCAFAGYATDRFARGRRLLVSSCMLGACAALFLLYAWNHVNPPASFIATAVEMVLLLLLGVAIAGPDSILAGPAAQELAVQSGVKSSQSTIVGLVDGLGSVGSIFQGPFTTLFVVSEVEGGGLNRQGISNESLDRSIKLEQWSRLHAVCGLLVILSVCALRSPLLAEAARKPW